MAQDHPGKSGTYWTVDGIEGRLARVELEDGQTVDLPLSSLPTGVREGDVLRFKEGDNFTLEIDHAATTRRRVSAQTQLDALNTAPSSGEIDL